MLGYNHNLQSSFGITSVVLLAISKVGLQSIKGSHQSYYDNTLAEGLGAALIAFDKAKHPLPGIRTSAAFGTFLEQLLESIHRAKYVSTSKLEIEQAKHRS